jgi:hypothetical protein
MQLAYHRPSKLSEHACLLMFDYGGGGGIRTPVTLSSQTVFKTAGFNRSPTPPLSILRWNKGLSNFPAKLVASWFHTPRFQFTLFGCIATSRRFIAAMVSPSTPLM